MAERISNDDIINSLLNESFYKSAGATSLADIAGNLSIKKASLYNHFDSREAIIKASYDECRKYLAEIYFTPLDAETVAKKYSPETVLKGCINRYFKMHEKEPLFQIYTFVESQKYFNQEAQDIIIEEKSKLLDQVKHLMQIFCTLDKISIKRDMIDSVCMWFVSATNDLMNIYLLNKKQYLMNNPATGKGELFNIQDDQTEMLKINALIDQFVILLKQ